MFYLCLAVEKALGSCAASARWHQFKVVVVAGWEWPLKMFLAQLYHEVASSFRVHRGKPVCRPDDSLQSLCLQQWSLHNILQLELVASSPQKAPLKCRVIEINGHSRSKAWSSMSIYRGKLLSNCCLLPVVHINVITYSHLNHKPLCWTSGLYST